MLLKSEGVDVQGCDLCPEYAQEFCEGIQIDQVDLNRDTLPYDDDSFDTLTNNEVLQYIENPVALFKEFSRVCKPGGHLVLTVPNILHIQSRLKFLGNGYPDFFKPHHTLPSEDKIPLLGINPVGLVEIIFLLDRFGWELKEVKRSRPKPGLYLFSPLAALIWLGGIINTLTSSAHKKRINSVLSSWTVLMSEGVLLVAQKK